ncbi:Ubiquitin carboxyl-terminal hydrolase family protein [Hibiscus syriacus]|uniref:Ubiquitin carboxyl-terminal hydrolase family protein n=1 Tax=Hibiscus syriacus TaxID=106335 RepID=A0A6A2Y7K0_HIBSY|nr:Ubiquitin carboxyl-terminal hydrolase family protein [Hibiscus syriacus]
MKEHREGSNLMEKYCDGCVLPVSNPFYHCSQCDFFLHKECAELPMEKQLWFHICQRFLILVADHIFRCGLCRSECNGFSYRCKECDIYYCLHCATRSYTIEHPSHEHPLYYDRNHKGRCSACDVTRRGLFRCKHCKISLHIQCLRQPLTAWHGCDEHLLALTYKEVSTYSQYLYCDICERKRDSNRWFYCCASCDVSVHLDCALGRYPFIKPGSIYRGLEDHPHPLTFVKKTFSCPGCHKCGIPCRDLCLECEDSTCGYVVHWDCAKPSHLKNQKIVLDTTETDESIPKGSVPNSSCVVLSLYASSQMHFPLALQHTSKVRDMEMEMGSQRFGHDHPMVFNDVPSNQTKKVTCSRCGEMVSGSSFSCAECEFYLHKKCAEAPPEIRHPYHRDHPLVLLPKSPYEKGRAICNFCGKTCEKFLYHCSCNLDLHVKCALLSFNIEKKGWYKVIEAKSLDDLAMVPRRSVDPIICIEKNKDGEMTEIKHFSHLHDLILQVNLMKEHREGSNLMEKYCDGCIIFLDVVSVKASVTDSPIGARSVIFIIASIVQRGATGSNILHINTLCTMIVSVKDGATHAMSKGAVSSNVRVAPSVCISNI